MTQDNNTVDPEAQGQNQSSDEDSPVIQELRKQIKDMAKELKAMPSRTDIEAELRAQLAREMAVENQLVEFGVPKGIRSVVEEKLGDAEPTAEAVAEALKAIGFEVDDSDDAEGDKPVENKVASELADVASLSAKVRSTAKDNTPQSAIDKINQAKSADELAAIAAEEGFLHSGY